MKEITNGELFANLDEAFINIERDNQPYVWQCKNYHVATFFELPIPMPPGSTIRYSFASADGDIAFGSKFIPKHGPEEQVIEANRVPSDVETISGSFKAAKEGTLVLIFDNSFSWFNSKQLSYRVELFQPAFIVADTLRCLRSRKMLQSLAEDSKKAQVRLVRCGERIGQLRADTSNLEERLSLLQSELESKKSSLAAAFLESEEMTKRILANLEKKNGLCIRCLDKKLVCLVLSFLGGRKSPAAGVCKYWYLCASALESDK